MKHLSIISTTLFASFCVPSAPAQGPQQYPRLSDYMMAPEQEIALAKSAAPENVSAHATIKVLTDAGYKVAAQGDNGFVYNGLSSTDAATLTVGGSFSRPPSIEPKPAPICAIGPSCPADPPVPIVMIDAPGGFVSTWMRPGSALIASTRFFA